MTTNASSDEHSPKRWPIVVAAICALALGLGTVRIIQSAKEAQRTPAPDSGAAPPAVVIVAPVELEEAQEHRVVTGSLRAKARAEVAAREAGAVDRMNVREGDLVKLGDSLVELDPDRLEAELAEAQAGVAAAESLIRQRKAEAERTRTDVEMKRPLLARDALSKREFLDSEQAMAVAEALEKAAIDAMSEASSRYELLKLRRDDLTIVAPFDGRVTARQVEVGEWVTPGQAVVTLVSSGDIEAWLQAPERFATTIATDPSGLRIFLNEGSEGLTPTSVQLVSDVDPASRIFPVIAVLENADGRLAPGMSVTGSIPMGELKPRVVVPMDSVIHSRQGSYVFKALTQPGSPLPVAAQVPVQVLFERDGRAFLKSGDLQEGDQVVTEGNERLFPNTNLIVSPSASHP